MKDSEVLKKRLVSGVIANFLKKPIIVALTLTSSVIVARILGPDSIAVIAVITSTTLSISAFSDLGVTKSISKIIPDLAVKFGQKNALKAFKGLIIIKLSFVLVGFLLIVCLDMSGWWKGRSRITPSIWFFPIVGTLLFLNSFIEAKSQEWASVFKLKSLAKLEISIAFITPFFSVLSALIFKNPYVVIGSTLIPILIKLMVLLHYHGYDLDDSKDVRQKMNLKDIMGTYWKYIGVTYIVFLSNKIIFNLPFSVFLLAECGVRISMIGNAAIAIALVSYGLDLTNTPLTGIRIPLISRLYAQNDSIRMINYQYILLVILVLMTTLASICIYGFATDSLNLLYGEKYYLAIKWGIPAVILALIFNLFSTGNATLRQVEIYKPIIYGIVLSGIYLTVSSIISVNYFPLNHLPYAVILNLVVSRGIFWLYTDFYGDKLVFKWKTTEIKLKGLCALIVSLSAMIGVNYANTIFWDLNKTLSSFFSFIVGITCFILIMRTLKLINSDVQNIIEGIIPHRFSWALKLIK